MLSVPSQALGQIQLREPDTHRDYSQSSFSTRYASLKNCQLHRMFDSNKACVLYAMCGFFSTGKGVQCFECKLEIEIQKIFLPNIMFVHYKHSPFCGMSKQMIDNVLGEKDLQEAIPFYEWGEQESVFLDHFTNDELKKMTLDECLKSLKDKKDHRSCVPRCRICRKRRIATMFLPCHHLMSCRYCGDMARECPVCNHAIHATTYPLITTSPSRKRICSNTSVVTQENVLSPEPEVRPEEADTVDIALLTEMSPDSSPLSSSLPLLPFPLIHRDSVPETIELEEEDEPEIDWATEEENAVQMFM